MSPDSSSPVAGVELEEAGEKWRAGDAAKSMRFFVRAVEMYDQGLQRYPTSLDLAYNKSVLCPIRPGQVVEVDTLSGLGLSTRWLLIPSSSSKYRSR
jgi:hypothetical protein